MKKLMLLFLVALVSVGLFACGDKDDEVERKFPHDGEFLAYVVSVNTRTNTPQVVFVTVTIENDEIVDYTIDTRQGTRTATTTTETQGEGDDAVEVEVTTYAFSWNPLTKLELGFDYEMLPASEIGKEWFEQAEALEAFWLENGLDAVTTDEDGYVDNVAGVSMRDAYSAVAEMAVENAEAGKFVAIYCPAGNRPDFYSVEMTLTENGEIDTLVIDVLQARGDNDTGVFAWRDQTKQELGYAYRMQGQGELSEADYIQWLEDNNKLEWFEQVALITDDIIENGWRANAEDDLPAGVSITADGYYTVLASLFAFAGDSVK
jgi:hypothetical protein